MLTRVPIIPIVRATMKGGVLGLPGKGSKHGVQTWAGGNQDAVRFLELVIRLSTSE